MLVPSLVCGTLAVWQLSRRNSKVDLLDKRTAALHSEPRDLFEMDALPQAFDLVQCRGSYDHASSMFVSPRVRTHMGIPEAGCIVVTPLYSPDRSRAVLVRRGWAPDTWRDASVTQRLAGAADAQPGSRAVGVVTNGEKGNSFVADNVPARGEWFTLDVAAMARHCGLPENTPLVELVGVDEDAGHAATALQIAADKYRGTQRARRPEVFPQPKKRDEYLEFSVMPYDHANYAMTWFLLAAATGFMASRLIRGLPLVNMKAPPRRKARV